MKKVIYNLLIGATTLLVASCMKVDNFDEPHAHFCGRIIDATTGENILADQGECHVRILEKSYSLNPSPQDIPVKQDGTFNNERLFNGTYDITPEGSWWPCNVTRLGIGKYMNHDFEVTPYLKIKDFTTELNGTTLTMSCRLFAPITEGLPQAMEIRPFLSLNQFCGAANHIDHYYTDAYRISLGNKTWDQLGDMATGEGYDIYTISVELKRGYIYFVRMGAKVKDTFEKFNYSEIVKIEVPNE